MSTFFQLFNFGEPSGTWLQVIAITGGTGRFEHATGEVTSFGDWVGISNSPPTLAWSGTHEGYITY
jgi:hypothetical protein